jgi:hypothetical protein
VPPTTERCWTAAHFASDEDVQHYQLERQDLRQELRLKEVIDEQQEQFISQRQDLVDEMRRLEQDVVRRKDSRSEASQAEGCGKIATLAEGV